MADNLHAVRDFVYNMQNPQADLEYRQSRNAFESYGHPSHNDIENTHLTHPIAADHIDSGAPVPSPRVDLHGGSGMSDLTARAHGLAAWADGEVSRQRAARQKTGSPGFQQQVAPEQPKHQMAPPKTP
jgi:hypothetical protein